MATAEPDYYCHKCQVHIGHVSNFQCPRCRESFIEEIDSSRPSSRTRRDRSHPGGRPHFHGSTPSGRRTIFVGGGGHSSDPRRQQNESPDIGTFFQAILGQVVGGSQFPVVTHNGGATGSPYSVNFNVFLSQFLNQMGENSGPAPASETNINSIPTVKVTAAQARDSLQCTICMDDFKENDGAKRLPCSHYFHEECISRWLRLHGTCPTCRITLDGDNTSSREYYNVHHDEEESSSSNRNTHQRNNNGSNSTLYDFD